MSTLTYQSLFAYLRQLGFVDRSRTGFERVFEHSECRLILAFGMLDASTEKQDVRPADLLSAEFRLQQVGLLNGSLTEAAMVVIGEH